jgi:hypothetical protein
VKGLGVRTARPMNITLTKHRCALDLVRVQRNRDKGQAGKRCAGTDRPDVKVTPRGRGAGIHWRRSVLLHAQRPAPRCVIDPPRRLGCDPFVAGAQPRILRRVPHGRGIVVRRGTRVRRRDPMSDPRKRTVRSVARSPKASVLARLRSRSTGLAGLLLG